MLALAIISILLVLISKNVRRDTYDQIQSNQYEEYYSAVEQELLKIISGQSVCDMKTGTGCMGIPLEQLKFYDALSSKYLDVITDTRTKFDNIAVGKDKNITIPLEGYNGNLKFRWTGQVAWVVNLDYKDHLGTYKTSQSVYDYSGSIFPGPISCLTFTPDGAQSFEFEINQCLGPLEPFGYTALSVRMKPIMTSGSSTELSLIDHSAGLPPQATILIATAVIDDDLGNSPAIQLELQIPTKDPSLEILDYALRTNKKVYKPQF
jgi:hypothetical protein